MKKIFTILLAITLSVAAAFSLASCSSLKCETDNGKAHTHSPATAVREKEIEATCTSRGEYDEVVYCRWCNYEFSREKKIVPAKHNYKDYVCTWCGDEVAHSAGLEFDYNNDGACYVSGIGTCTDADVIIPIVSPEGDSVTGIGFSAFDQCYSLTSIVIPDSVTSIGDRAFNGCVNLTIGAIPTSITSIGFEAFSHCDSLTSIVIPDSVISIGNCAFASCDNLTDIIVSGKNEAYKAVDGNLYTKDGKTLIQYAKGKANESFLVPDDVKHIGDGAFEDCDSLTNIIINDSLTSISANALVNCDNLILNTYDNGEYLGNEANPYVALVRIYNYDITSSLSVHANTKVIKDCLFSDCYTLTSITVADENTAFKSIDGNLYTKDGKLIQYAKGKDEKSFIVPDGVTCIGAYAFSECTRLTSVVIPDSVTSIGDRAFNHCRSLNMVEIGNGVTSIGWQAFAGCENLTIVEIGDSVNSIGESAFGGCTNISSVVIPDSVTSIGDRAFENCESLNSVVIGEGVTSIGDFAFNSCKNPISVYYKGTSQEWKTIIIGGHSLSNDIINCYSEEEPNYDKGYIWMPDGFWHYDSDGKIVIWNKE